MISLTVLMSRFIRELGLCSFGLLLSATLLCADEPYPFGVKATGAGRPMILIPGLGSAGEVWNETVAHFEKEFACHVLVPAGFAGQPAIAAERAKHFIMFDQPAWLWEQMRSFLRP